MSAAMEQSARGKLCAQLLGRPARFRVAVPIRKTHDAVGVGDVEKLRLRSDWIERETEWLVQAAFGESLRQVGFAVAICVP